MTDGWTIANVIADSVAGLGAAGALLIAGRTMRRQEDGSRRAQASKVTLHSHILGRNESDAPKWVAEHVRKLSHTRPGTFVYEFRVDNLSDLPIYNVMFHVPMQLLTEPGRPDLTGVINPWVRRLDPNAHYEELFESDVTAWSKESILWFTDAAGRTWRRKIDGQLSMHRTRPTIFRGGFNLWSQVKKK